MNGKFFIAVFFLVVASCKTTNSNLESGKIPYDESVVAFDTQHKLELKDISAPVNGSSELIEALRGRYNQALSTYKIPKSMYERFKGVYENPDMANVVFQVQQLEIDTTARSGVLKSLASGLLDSNGKECIALGIAGDQGECIKRCQSISGKSISEGLSGFQAVVGKCLLKAGGQVLKTGKQISSFQTNDEVQMLLGKTIEGSFTKSDYDLNYASDRSSYHGGWCTLDVDIKASTSNEGKLIDYCVGELAKQDDKFFHALFDRAVQSMDVESRAKPTPNPISPDKYSCECVGAAKCTVISRFIWKYPYSTRSQDSNFDLPGYGHIFCGSDQKEKCATAIATIPACR